MSLKENYVDLSKCPCCKNNLNIKKQEQTILASCKCGYGYSDGFLGVNGLIELLAYQEEFTCLDKKK